VSDLLEEAGRLIYLAKFFQGANDLPYGRELLLAQRARLEMLLHDSVLRRLQLALGEIVEKRFYFIAIHGAPHLQPPFVPGGASSAGKRRTAER
jgi:hypothetical protein